MLHSFWHRETISFLLFMVDWVIEIKGIFDTRWYQGMIGKKKGMFHLSFRFSQMSFASFSQITNKVSYTPACLLMKRLPSKAYCRNKSNQKVCCPVFIQLWIICNTRRHSQQFLLQHGQYLIISSKKVEDWVSTCKAAVQRDPRWERSNNQIAAMSWGFPASSWRISESSLHLWECRS